VPSARELLDLAQARVREAAPGVDLVAMGVCFHLIRAADRIVADLETVHRTIGWSFAGFRVLFWVWLLGPLEPREIASLASASRASISSVLNTLERDGFVLRRRESSDRRLVQVELTGRGEKLIAEAFQAHNERERRWVSVLNEQERATLVELVGRLLDYEPPASLVNVLTI